MSFIMVVFIFCFVFCFAIDVQVLLTSIIPDLEFVIVIHLWFCFHIFYEM